VLDERVEARPVGKPMHLQPVFAKHPVVGGRVAEQLFENGLCVPSGSRMTGEDRERVVEGIVGVAGPGLRANFGGVARAVAPSSCVCD